MAQSKRQGPTTHSLLLSMQKKNFLRVFLQSFISFDKDPMSEISLKYAQGLPNE